VVAIEEGEGEDDWVRCRLDIDTGG